MAYDSTRQRVVLIGGRGPGTFVYGDTWEFDPATSSWTQVFPATTTPGASQGHVMAYDQARGQMIMFNGNTWRWSGTDWIQILVTPPSIPPYATMVYDAA